MPPNGESTTRHTWPIVKLVTDQLEQVLDEEDLLNDHFDRQIIFVPHRMLVSVLSMVTLALVLSKGLAASLILTTQNGKRDMDSENTVRQPDHEILDDKTLMETPANWHPWLEWPFS